MTHAVRGLASNHGPNGAAITSVRKKCEQPGCGLPYFDVGHQDKTTHETALKMYIEPERVEQWLSSGRGRKVEE